MRLGIAKPENFVFICLCARLSLSLWGKDNIKVSIKAKKTVIYQKNTERLARERNLH
ncbi:hypothetical protein HMPREF9441_03706 [Paraprevotella clara YIT 11840]|uniref:Uncharacterized protein n=1 Tax=Paraprevotella clara YIT 11840 TaxID=762968 RepID=G5SWD3_9BACT|nr:hypothetical protein HMPREF9441_03706 [Paraprevotella clara YIT 11840]